MFYVKCQGKDLRELRKSVEEALRDLEGKVSKGTVKVERVVDEDLHAHGNEADDDMIDVPSPFAQTAPELSTSTVVDNELDAEGIPWDKRIHSSSRAKVKNGSWKIARGVTDEQAAPIKAELRARVAGQRGIATPAQLVPPSYTPPALVEVPVVQAPVVAPPVVQAAPPMPMMNMGLSGHTLDTFRKDFGLVIANLISVGKINQDYVNQLCAFFKVAEIWQANAEQQAMVFEQLVSYGFIQKAG